MPARATDRTRAKILDAALRVLVDFGVKRATVELVANYAGVSHMTVYRRWSTKNEVLRLAVLTELAAMVSDAVTCVEGTGPFPDQVVSAFTELVDSLRQHPLLVRLLNTEPEVLMPLLSDQSSAVLDSTVPIISEALERLSGQPLDDPDTLADVFVRLAHSVLLLRRSERPLSTRHDIEIFARQALPSLARAAAPAPARISAPEARRRGVAPLMAASAAAVLIGGGLLLNPVVHDVMHTDVVGTVSSVPSPAATTHQPSTSPPSGPAMAPADSSPSQVSTTASSPLPASSRTADVATTATSRTPQTSRAPAVTPRNGSGSINSPSFRPPPPTPGRPPGPPGGPRPGALGPAAPGAAAGGSHSGRGPS